MLDSGLRTLNNGHMRIPGRNGVVVLEGGPALPNGTPVTVSCELAPVPKKPAERKKVHFPLVRSKKPGRLHLTAERVAEFLEDEDVSP